MKKLIPFYFNVFASYLGTSMMVLIFTLMFFAENQSATVLSMSSFEKANMFGLLITLFPLGQFLGSPVIGALTDRFGRRSIILITLFCAFLSYVTISISFQFDLLMLMGMALFFGGLFESNIALTQNVIADLFVQKKRAVYFSYIGTMTSSAYLLGPLFVGFLSKSTQFSWITAATPFWFVTFLLAIIFLWIALFFEETHIASKRVHVHWLQALSNVKNIFCDKQMRLYYLLTFITCCAKFGFFRFLPLYLTEQFSLSTKTIALVISFGALPMFLNTLFFLPRFLKRYTVNQIFKVSSIVYCPMSLVLLFVTDFNWIWPVVFFTFICSSFSMMTLMPIISNQAPENRQGGVMGNNMSVLLLAQIVIGPIGGLLAGHWFKSPLILCSLLSLVAGLYFCKLDLKPKTCL
ncbi:MAG: MFS transporter [Rhabdochlamydiaceae bacterium]|nr:MFS transporter [Candidatus Amphrikana amoebophyrae]